MAMAATRQYNFVKLFIGVLVSHAKLMPELEQAACCRLRPIDHRSPVIPFDFTDYYEPEMGDILDRIISRLSGLLKRISYRKIKQQTNRLEEENSAAVSACETPGEPRPGLYRAGEKSFSPLQRIFITESI